MLKEFFLDLYENFKEFIQLMLTVFFILLLITNFMMFLIHFLQKEPRVCDKNIKRIELILPGNQLACWLDQPLNQKD